MEGVKYPPNQNKNNKTTMSCSLSQDTLIGCKEIGGIDAVYLGTWNGTSMVFGITNSSYINAVTGVTVSFYSLQQQPSTAEYTSPAVVSTQNNTIGYTQTLKFMIYSMQANTSNTIKTIGQGIFRAMFKTRSGRYFMIGVNGQATLASAEMGSGVGMSDLNGATLTISAEDSTPFWEVDPTVALSLIQ
jgi:hypothetical protein